MKHDSMTEPTGLQQPVTLFGEDGPPSSHANVCFHGILAILKSIDENQRSMAESFRLLADAYGKPPELVKTRYVADKLGITTTHVAAMARDGTIPVTCIVPGSGSSEGTQWKFFRERIDKWIEKRERSNLPLRKSG